MVIISDVNCRFFQTILINFRFTLLLTENTATFGYPDDNQAQAYCSAFRMSIIAITLMAVAMHGIAIACAVCLTNNARDGRESLVHEVSIFTCLNGGKSLCFFIRRPDYIVDLARCTRVLNINLFLTSFGSFFYLPGV